MPFRLPTRVTIRAGCVDDLAEIVRAEAAPRVLLVFDRGLAATVWPARVQQQLGAAGAEVSTFDEIEPNPRRRTVDRLGDRAREDGVRLVVGLGGGSVLDAAKAVSMLIENPGGCEAYEGRNRFPVDPVPFVAIPSTCGTGSEVTWVSVITHEDEQRKLSVKGDGMFPDHALVDPDLLTTLPAELVAYTGMDAVTHAVEAVICREANPVSDALAEEALRGHFASLRAAHADVAGHAAARFAVARASTLAGMAFGNADVAGVHCLSESLGGMFDVPHGLANAILLPPMLRYQREAISERLGRLHGAVIGDGSADPAGAMIHEIERLSTDLGIPPFRALGVERGSFAAVAERAEGNNSNPSNPRPMRAADYVAVLDDADGR